MQLLPSGFIQRMDRKKQIALRCKIKSCALSIYAGVSTLNNIFNTISNGLL